MSDAHHSSRESNGAAASIEVWNLPGRRTTSRDHERATVSVRGTVQMYDPYQGVDDPSWTDRLPHMVMVNDSVDVINERTPSEAALASLRLTKGN